MALTDAQKAQVRRYLGFPDVGRESDGLLEGAMDALSVEGEALVVVILTALADIQTKLSAAQTRMQIVQIEDVKFAGGDEVKGLWAEGNRLAADLAVTLGITARRRPFGGGGGTRMTYRG